MTEALTAKRLTGKTPRTLETLDHVPQEKLLLWASAEVCFTTACPAPSLASLRNDDPLAKLHSGPSAGKADQGLTPCPPESTSVVVAFEQELVPS